MKVVLHYRASPGFRRTLTEAVPDGLAIAVVDEADIDGFAREMADAEVLRAATKMLPSFVPNVRQTRWVCPCFPTHHPVFPTLEAQRITVFFQCVFFSGFF